MKKLNSCIDQGLSGIPGVDMSALRRAQRAETVRSMWSSLVDPVFLEHTNNVFVFEKDGMVEMHVYVDESIYAAELNNQRELIKWRCRQEFGEAIDAFHIHISRGKYKGNHPFTQTQPLKPDSNDPIPLDSEELEKVNEACENIPEGPLRESFRKAMISDLEWKKGNRH